MIALLTDFGNSDGAVASMKGVIKSINPNIEIIDISHDISSFSVREAAFTLYRCYQYFPTNTIFVSVVDPGVGSNRKEILVYNDKYYFIGPDNGCFSYVIDEKTRFISLKNKIYHLETISSTFHGRDIFAPSAAYLSLDTRPEDFGNPLEKIDTFNSQQVRKINSNIIICEVLFIDKFGNVYTNIELKDFNFLTGHFYEIYNKDNKNIIKLQFSNNFSGVGSHEALIYLGSSNLIELAINQGNLAKEVDIKIGDTLKIISLSNLAQEQ